jgi:hypothetical protein
MPTSEAADLVSRFHDLEQEMSDVRSQLSDMGIDPYHFDLDLDGDSEDSESEETSVPAR